MAAPTSTQSTLIRQLTLLRCSLLPSTARTGAGVSPGDGIGRPCFRWRPFHKGSMIVDLFKVSSPVSCPWGDVPETFPCHPALGCGKGLIAPVKRIL